MSPPKRMRRSKALCYSDSDEDYVEPKKNQLDSPKRDSTSVSFSQNQIEKSLYNRIFLFLQDEEDSVKKPKVRRTRRRIQYELDDPSSSENEDIKRKSTVKKIEKTPAIPVKKPYVYKSDSSELEQVDMSIFASEAFPMKAKPVVQAADLNMTDEEYLWKKYGSLVPSNVSTPSTSKQADTVSVIGGFNEPYVEWDDHLNLPENEIFIKINRALHDERRRIALLKKRTTMLEQMEQSENELILDFDQKTNTKIVVHPQLVELLKQHQKEAVRFLYDCCFTSMTDYNIRGGSGAIL